MKNFWAKWREKLKQSWAKWRKQARKFWAAEKVKIKRFFTIEVVRDPDLIHAYMGKKYAKFEERRFNFAGLFFTVIYLLFRKLYVAGVVMFILNILLINMARGHVLYFFNALWIGIIANILMGIVIGFCVNRYYIFAVGVKIGRLKLKYPGRSQAEMRGICEAKGGTNSIALTVGLLAKIVSSIVMVINMILNEAVFAIESPLTNIVKDVQTEIESIKSEVESTVQNGTESLKNIFERTLNSGGGKTKDK